MRGVLSAELRHSPEHFFPMRGVLLRAGGNPSLALPLVSVPGTELTTLGSIYQLTPTSATAP